MKYPRVKCDYCSKDYANTNIKRHMETCILNPVNLVECVVCSKPVKTKDAVTCGYSCSNTYFRSGPNNPNWKDDNYQSTCFHYHERKCLVCGEDKIVAAHHVNHDHHDNRPENLVPLCPTHHQYVHSRFADEVTPIIDKYLETFSV